MKDVLQRTGLAIVGGSALLGAVILGLYAISVSPADDAWYDELARDLWVGPSVARFIAGVVAIFLGFVAFEFLRPEPSEGR